LKGIRQGLKQWILGLKNVAIRIFLSELLFGMLLKLLHFADGGLFLNNNRQKNIFDQIFVFQLDTNQHL
jgi:hypothetical protein